MGVAGTESLDLFGRPALLEGAVGAMASGDLDATAILRIADELPLMLAYFDGDMRFTFVNRATAEFFERPRHAIVGRRADELPPQDQPRLLDALRQALAGERVRLVSSFDHPSRGPLAGVVEYIPLRAADGQVGGVIMLVQDITEQRASETALKESEQRFRRIADSAPAPMWLTRNDGSREFVNQAFADFFGVRREQARRLQWSRYLHPADSDRVTAKVRRAMRTATPYSTLARYRRRDGQWRWLQSTSQPRLGERGEFLGFIGVATDITLAKEAELELRRLVEERTCELRESEQRFRAIFDTVLEIVILLKPDGTVVDSNYGSDPEQRARAGIGLPLWESPMLTPFPDYQAMLRDLIPVAAGGEQVSREITLKRPGLPPSTFDLSLQPVRGTAGQITYLLLEARDITDLKATQEQLRQSQKMEALGQLTGGIAHDFNNLLTVVVGGLDLIAKRIEDDKLKRYAANALAAAERGAKLTAQLLAFSRVQRLEVRPVRIGPLIEHVQPLLRNVLGPTIDLALEQGDRDVTVLADATQLELALLNLAINARDAMPAGGSLTVSKRIVQLTGDSDLGHGCFVELAVRDTGEGMTSDVQARVFEPFFTTKEVGKGTGLGLSMVYGVAHQSGGTVRIDSAPGQGTTVRLYFRSADSPVEEDPVAVPLCIAREAAPAATQVLVIDDDPDVRGFIVTSLAELGYAVSEAADGQSGLARFADHRPDLVVLDYAMPGMSGADVAERLLQERPGQPILFVSGYRETEAIRRTAPDAPLLTKPFRADTLDSAVRGVLGVRTAE